MKRHFKDSLTSWWIAVALFLALAYGLLLICKMTVVEPLRDQFGKMFLSPIRRTLERRADYIIELFADD